jgi:hypothetical protein
LKIQSDGRIRKWAKISEVRKYLRVILLEDGETVNTILSYLYRKYLMEEIKAESDKPAREFKEEATKKICQVMDEMAVDSEKQRRKINRFTRDITKNPTHLAPVRLH